MLTNVRQQKRSIFHSYYELITLINDDRILRLSVVVCDSVEAHLAIHSNMSLGTDNDADPPSLSAFLRLGQDSQNLGTSSLSLPSLYQVARLLESSQVDHQQKFPPLRSVGNEVSILHTDVGNPYRLKSNQ
ncbi:hypothetical protein Golomagni_02708 [Golovinomyces magnicellulatus]|nr:hypothetical protein Golomagni_02708 [Golovinomyces magnicellulatus]